MNLGSAFALLLPRQVGTGPPFLHVSALPEASVWTCLSVSEHRSSSRMHPVCPQLSVQMTMQGGETVCCVSHCPSI